MTSEIRANTLKNRVGLGTIEYSNTGPVISGVTTASNFKTGTSNLHSTGLNIFDLDVDGHTNLDNVSIAGVTTHADNASVKFGTDADFSINHSGTSLGMLNTTGEVLLRNTGGSLYFDCNQISLRIAAGSQTMLNAASSGVSLYTGNTVKLATTGTGVSINEDLDVDGHTNLDNVSVAGVSTFSGNADFSSGLDVTGNITGTGDLFLTADTPKIRLIDNNADDDFQISNFSGNFIIKDITNSVDRFTIQSNGNVSINNDLDVDGHTNLDNVSVAGISTFSGILDATNTPASIRVAQDIQHKGDADTKITFPADNMISVETAGSERLRIDNQGSVMINGTTSFGSPVKLQVRGASSAISDGAQIFDIASTAASNGGTRLAFGVNEDNYTWIRSYESAVGGRDLVFAASAETLRITSGGNVGIGEDAPSEKLQVKGDVLLGSTGSDVALKFEYNNHQFAKVVGNGRDGSGYGDIDFYTSTGSGVTNLTQRMTIRAEGKIGIGTVTPNGDLDVFNSNQAISIVRGVQATLAILGDSDNVGGSETDSRIILCSDGTIANQASKLTTSPLQGHGFEIALINEEPGSGLRFHDGTANAERLRITSGGKMGLNHNSPPSQFVVRAPGGSGHCSSQVHSGDSSTIMNMQTVQGSEGRFGMNTNHNLAIYTNGLEKLHLSKTGSLFLKCLDTVPVNQAESGHYASTGYNAGHTLGLMVKRSICVSDADTKGVGGIFLSHTRNVACNGTTYNMMTLHNREGTFVGDVYVGFSVGGAGTVRHYKFTCLYASSNATSIDYVTRGGKSESISVNISTSNDSHFFQVIPNMSTNETARVTMTIVGAACGRNDGAGGDYYTVNYN